MNWLKKQINKIFIKDDANEYEELYEETEDGYDEEKQVTTKKSSFRFPLIADTEITPQPQQINNTNSQSEQLEQPFALPKHLQDQSSQVFDVEVSGIRDLLERRQKGFSTIVRSRGVETRKDTETKEIVNYLKNDVTNKETIVKNEIINPLGNRKRFVPTDVPSPVHGFRRITPIEELLPKKLPQQPDTDITPIISADGLEEVVATTSEVESELPKIEVNSVQIEQLSDGECKLPDIKRATFENETDSIGADENIADQLSDLKVKHLTIENSTIHIGQLHVETTQEDELSQVDQVEEATEKGSRLPFNVLMLKSDKEKLKAKEILQKHNEEKKVDATLEAIEQEEKESLEIHIPLDTMATITAVDAENDKIAIEKEGHSEQNEHGNISFDQNNGINEQKELVSEHNIQEVEKNTQDRINHEQKTMLTENEEHESQQNSDLPEQDEARPEQKEMVTLQKSIITQSNQAVDDKEETTTEESLPKYSRMYVKPPLAYLAPPEEKTEDWAWMDEQGDRLIEALSHFQVQAQIESIVQGPAVTQFEITVAHGTKVSKVRNLSDDIKLALAARDIRIDAPIPGKRSIGIEIPNRLSRAVRLSEVTNSDAFNESDSPLEAALGLDLTGKPVTLDLRKMPHGLIAGATGSGKSVCINSILVSLLYKAEPHELKLMLIDPKMVELAPFNHIPHLVSPVITDVKTATGALKWAVEEMERRYQLFMHAGARDITRYNAMAESKGQFSQKLPYLLIVIDELADLMMMSPADVEEAICRIAQKARACGIHLILATQRPSVDVITGLIKSNIPTRIAFAVSSAVDSRTILDTQGAERLLGRGDMLYLGNGMPAATRIQGTFVTDDEIEEIIEHVRQQGEPEYMFQHEDLLKRAEVIEEQDELFEEVCRFVYEQGTASTSSIQRRYHIGYNRAARLVDMLEKHGFVSEQRGSKPREVFITDSDIISMFES
ncbi:DNA translocase FtsK [Lysinibacillus sp. 54212]|uniref:DNA translocase FtsK n=1 Tax=Lysinibacillus sp. 54212 TaxID=3119829 RepID=UPI002FC692B2